MTLAELRPPCRCRVVSAGSASAEMQTRLYALGLYPGVDVAVLRFAPLGDPIQVKIGQALLSIRRNDASMIEVEMTT